MHIVMKDLLDGDGHVLAGALTGRKAYGKLLELTVREPNEPETVFLDFEGIEVATASYLRESVLNFRDTVRRRRSNYYPVIANASDDVSEELSVLLSPRRDVLMLCSFKNGKAHHPRLLGDLDPKQQVTFELVKKKGETNASELHEHHNSDKVEQTAWNNRLAALAGLGLIVELSQGRAKRYRPLLIGG